MTESSQTTRELTTFQKLIRWIVTLTVPIVLVLLTIRLMLGPWYLEFEYRTPGFPDDRYGFSQEDRLYWSKLTLDYLVNDAGIEYLADMRFPEGEQVPQPSCSFVDDCSRVYNDRELRHMLDVKQAVQTATIVLWIGIGLLVVSAGIAWQGMWLDQYWKAIARGGWLTVIIAVAIILFVLVAFGIIFVWFHQIFFEPGTWTFFYSDTLIRLFPERFWRDTFLIVAGVPTLIGAALGYFLGRK